MVKVREASPEDCLDIYRWRNDEVTRQMSQTTDKVARKEHEEWFAASLKNRRRLLVICEDECGDKIGIVHFEVKGNRALISINIAPHQRGRGLARACITEGIALLNSRFENIHVVKSRKYRVEREMKILIFRDRERNSSFYFRFFSRD